MTAYLVCSRRATDAELITILTDPLEPERRATWCFIEGPTRCEFVDPADVVQHADWLARLWQVRLFTEECEIAARRRDFQDNQPWMVRWIASMPPAGIGWSTPIPLSAGKPQQLLLYGEVNAEGNFQEGRFRRAALKYPGSKWETGDQAALVTEVYDLDDGAIVRWKGIAKDVPASEGSDRAKP
jgi:hypothetical protein